VLTTDATVCVVLLGDVIEIVDDDADADDESADVSDETTEDADDAAEDKAETPDDTALDALLAAELTADTPLDAALLAPELAAGTLPVETAMATGASVSERVSVVPPLIASSQSASPPESELGSHRTAAVMDACGISSVSATTAEPSTRVKVKPEPAVTPLIR